MRFIGVVELLGGLGLLLPAVSRVLPWLTPLAAAGLGVIMALASVTHLARGEAPMVLVNVVLGALAAFVAWGRLVKAPIQSRT